MLPIGQAAERAHLRYFDEARECGQGIQPRSTSKRNANEVLAWHECADIYKPTGAAGARARAEGGGGAAPHVACRACEACTGGHTPARLQE